MKQITACETADSAEFPVYARDALIPVGTLLATGRH